MDVGLHLGCTKEELELDIFANVVKLQKHIGPILEDALIAKNVAQLKFQDQLVIFMIQIEKPLLCASDLEKCAANIFDDSCVPLDKRRPSEH